MKKILFIFLCLLNLSAFAADVIPDPTVQIATPPAGLPGMSTPNITLPIGDFLKFEGVLLVEEDTPVKYNKVIFNGKVYRVNDVVAEKWKVKSISANKVVLINLETKALKNFNTGE